MSDTSAKPTRMRLWLRILLGASLALNLLIFGIIGGALAGWHGGKDRAPRAEAAATAYVRALPREDRRKLGREIRKAYRADGLSRAAERRVQHLMLEALRTDPFDAAAVAVLLEKESGAARTRRDTAQAVWLNHVEGMSAQGRAAYADELEKILERAEARASERKAKKKKEEK